MYARKLPNGDLLVPVRAESEDGTLGDALAAIGPSHPDYAAWLPFVRGEARDDERPPFTP
jgi:hypothetical protein